MRTSSDVALVTSARAAALRVTPAVVLVYAGAAAAALATVALAPLAGAIACALLTTALLNHHLGAGEGDAEAVLPALALVPLLGLLAVAMPIDEGPPLAWPVLVGLPMALAVALVAKGGEPLLRVRDARRQALIGCTGLPLGLLAWLALQPDPVADRLDVGTVVLGVVALGVFAGLLEEAVFRGIVQHRCMRVLGGRGIAWTALLSAAAWAGSRSLAAVLAAGIAALACGLVASRTGSVAGVGAARGLALVGLLLVWPHLLGAQPARDAGRESGGRPAVPAVPVLPDPAERAAPAPEPRRAAPAARPERRKAHRRRRRRAAAPVASSPAPARVVRAAVVTPPAVRRVPAPRTRPAPAPRPAPRPVARPTPRPAPAPPPTTFDDSG